MFRFNWNEVCDDALLRWLLEQAGAPSDADASTIRPPVLKLLTSLGGLPVANSPKEASAMAAIAQGLLKDAIAIAYPAESPAVETSGYVLSGSKVPAFDKVIAGRALVHVNFCDAEELRSLPGIGDTVARQVVLERNHNGPYSGAEDLARRVRGLGENTLAKLEGCVRYTQELEGTQPGSFDIRLRALVVSTGLSSVRGLQKVLDGAVMRCASGQYRRWFETRMYDAKLEEPEHACEWIGLLSGKEYVPWLESALVAATSSVDMAMFHIAMGKAEAAVNTLVQGLITARKVRNARVRVLLDQDRPKDPYLSAVINSEALAALRSADVAAKFDAPERLLHSKFLIIDRTLVVMGSHNWSAGSFASYEDMSVAVRSPSLADALSKRFEEMWAAAPTPAPSSAKPKEIR